MLAVCVSNHAVLKPWYNLQFSINIEHNTDRMPQSVKYVFKFLLLQIKQGKGMFLVQNS